MSGGQDSVSRTLHESVPVTPVRPVAFGRASFDANLLVVEDTPVNQDIAASLLGRMKCRVTVAADGFEAIARAADGGYDLIFMDCEMPRLDGFAATREIRQAADTAVRTPIVAMTAHRPADVQAACLASGMDDVLGKPLSYEALTAVLRRWIGPLEIQAPQTPAPTLIAPQPGPDTGVLDMTALAGISGLTANNGALLTRLVTRFATTAPRLVGELHAHCANADPEAARVTAHALRSSAMALGAAQLAALTAQIEKAGQNRDTIALAGLIPQLDGVVEKALAALQTLAGRQP